MEFKFKTPSDLKELPKNADAWLIHNLLPKDSCCLVSGAPKTRKSWFVYEILVSIATGTAAFGMRESSKGGVMLVQGEDSEGIIRERLSLLVRSHGLLPDSLGNVNILAGHPFHLDNDDHYDWLTSAVVRQNPSLLILDPFIRLIPNTSENSSGPVSRILGKLRGLQRATGATILVVHHCGKDGKTRGSSDFHGWLDAGFYLGKPTEDITQVKFEFKGFKECPDLFFKLEKVAGGILPVGITLK